MLKPKSASAPEPPPMPQVGDKVKLPNVQSVLEITHVSHDGEEVNLQLPNTNLQWFRVRTDTLTFVDRKPPAKTANPFTTPEPVFNTKEVLDRIAALQRENLKRSDDDIDILKTWLKTQHVPLTVIEALEGVTIDQHKSWKKAIVQIAKLLEE
jgi:hypothetical protein